MQNRKRFDISLTNFPIQNLCNAQINEPRPADHYCVWIITRKLTGDLSDRCCEYFEVKTSRLICVRRRSERSDCNHSNQAR